MSQNLATIFAQIAEDMTSSPLNKKRLLQSGEALADLRATLDSFVVSLPREHADPFRDVFLIGRNLLSKKSQDSEMFMRALHKLEASNFGPNLKTELNTPTVSAQFLERLEEKARQLSQPEFIRQDRAIEHWRYAREAALDLLWHPERREALQKLVLNVEAELEARNINQVEHALAELNQALSRYDELGPFRSAPNFYWLLSAVRDAGSGRLPAQEMHRILTRFEARQESFLDSLLSESTSDEQVATVEPALEDVEEGLNFLRDALSEANTESYQRAYDHLYLGFLELLQTQNQGVTQEAIPSRKCLRCFGSNQHSDRQCQHCGATLPRMGIDFPTEHQIDFRSGESRQPELRNPLGALLDLYENYEFCPSPQHPISSEVSSLRRFFARQAERTDAGPEAKSLCLKVLSTLELCQKGIQESQAIGDLIQNLEKDYELIENRLRSG